MGGSRSCWVSPAVVAVHPGLLSRLKGGCRPLSLPALLVTPAGQGGTDGGQGWGGEDGGSKGLPLQLMASVNTKQDLDCRTLILEATTHHFPNTHSLHTLPRKVPQTLLVAVPSQVLHVGRVQSQSECQGAWMSTGWARPGITTLE